MAELRDISNWLRSLGSVAEMQQSARSGIAPGRVLRCNSHVHLPPNFSTFGSMAEAVHAAISEEVRLLGVTNYYDYHVYADFAECAWQQGIYPVFGLEIISIDPELRDGGIRVNDPNNPGRMYLCGKGALGVTNPSVRANELLGRIRTNDEQRMRAMLEKLQRYLAGMNLRLNLSYDSLVAEIAEKHHCPAETVVLQERHIACGLQERLFDCVSPADLPIVLHSILGKPSVSPNDFAGVQGELRSALLKSGKPAFVKESFLPRDEALELIRELGAIPCYPVLADGAEPICSWEQPPEILRDHLLSLDISMAECIPERNTKAVLLEYVRTLRDGGIAVVAGTEHNSPDPLSMEPACKGGVALPEELREIFYEGMCVAVAHQFLIAHGESGFVGGIDRTNSDGSAREKHIETFASLGRTVLSHYFQKKDVSYE